MPAFLDRKEFETALFKSDDKGVDLLGPFAIRLVDEIVDEDCLSHGYNLSVYCALFVSQLQIVSLSYKRGLRQKYADGNEINSALLPSASIIGIARW